MPPLDQGGPENEMDKNCFKSQNHQSLKKKIQKRKNDHLENGIVKKNSVRSSKPKYHIPR